MQYSILRFEKHKSETEVRSFYMHANRECKVEHADPDRENLVLVDKQKEHERFLKETKCQKNAVRGIEFVMPMSRETHEHFEKNPAELELWAERNKAWVEDRFQKENLMYFAIHKDEHTYHATGIILPRIDGKLNGTYMLQKRDDNGRVEYGPKAMSRWQDEYHEYMKGFYPEIQRGTKGTGVKHTTVKEYHEQVDRYMNHSAPLERTPEPEDKKQKIMGTREETAREWIERNSGWLQRLKEDAKMGRHLEEKKQEQIRQLEEVRRQDEHLQMLTQSLKANLEQEKEFFAKKLADAEKVTEQLKEARDESATLRAQLEKSGVELTRLQSVERRFKVLEMHCPSLFTRSFGSDIENAKFAEKAIENEYKRFKKEREKEKEQKQERRTEPKRHYDDRER